jgi:hypothetical protein
VIEKTGHTTPFQSRAAVHLERLTVPCGSGDGELGDGYGQEGVNSDHGGNFFFFFFFFFFFWNINCDVGFCGWSIGDCVCEMKAVGLPVD